MVLVIAAALAAILFSAAPAHAGPLIGWIAGALTSIGVGAGVANVVAGAIVIGLTVAAQSLFSGRRKDSGTEQQFDLSRPDSLPVYRVVYGKAIATGTPCPPAVKGTILAGCWLLSSRPAHGEFTLYLDKREVTLSGDPFDFSGPGATPTNEPFAGYVKVWIGKGDQTTAPDAIVSEFADDYLSTDAWTGRTVVWLRLDAGDNASRSERWPAGSPEVMMDGKWTPVFDPRDAAQSIDDPATWTWSANQARCALDGLIANPVKPYSADNLWLDTWKWGADVADEAVAVAGGGTIPRYEVNGTLIYAEDKELEDQLEPLMEAGAARFTRARGQLGIIPGAPVDVTTTLTDILDSGTARFVRYQSNDGVYDRVQAKYRAPDRFLESASLPPYVAGAGDRTLTPDLSMVTDYRQGERVQKIMLMRTRKEKRITAQFPPSSLNLVAGSIVNTDFASPFSGWAGKWEVAGMLPALFSETDDDGNPTGGVFGRCELTLAEYDNDIFAWDAETEEVAVAQYDFDAEVPPVAPPSDVDVYMDATNDATEAGIVRPRFRAEFTPSPSGSVTDHEWQIRLSGDDWPSESTTVSTGSDDPTVIYGSILSQTELQDFRIRASGPRGKSGWIVVPGLSRGFALVSVTVTAGTGEVDVSATAPANAVFFGWQVRRGAVGGDFADAAIIHEQYGLQPQAALAATITGQAAGTYDYWLAPVSQSYTLGTPSGPFTRTIS